jgi:hypothetical protein
MPNWLWRSITGISVTIVVIAAAQWASCRFYVLPAAWPWYARYVGTQQGKSIDLAPMGCADADSRAIAVMTGVLTTLISLSRKAE